jgi:fermentation-respiration switch protein FrsA (DUF1100 family)
VTHRSSRATTSTRFTFQSEGATVVGNLFMPSREAPAGVVVAVGPLTSVKEQAAGTYAQAMAERGYAALAFDYRFFGESEGRPRQFENPNANIEDIKSAGTALLADDRLAHMPLFGLGVCGYARCIDRRGAGCTSPRRRRWGGHRSEWGPRRATHPGLRADGGAAFEPARRAPRLRDERGRLHRSGRAWPDDHPAGLRGGRCRVAGAPSGHRRGFGDASRPHCK